MYAGPSELVLTKSRCVRGYVPKSAQNTQQTSLGIEWSPIESWTWKSDSTGWKIKAIARIKEVDEIEGKLTRDIIDISSC